MDYKEKTARLRLIRSKNIGPITFSLLLQRYGTGLDAVAAIPEMTKNRGIKSSLISVAAAEGEIAAAEKFGARVLVRGEADYPSILGHYDDAPGCLTIRGDGHLFKKNSIAMVGSRNASSNACVFAERLARSLSEQNIVITSGMARGIDSAAHRGSLTHGTIAVMAGGIDQIYPRENQGLYNQIAETGLLVSEMPFGTMPVARLFPIRNRIVASLSVGIIVVEANLKSGSLITAREGAERGLEVMAVPGSPLDPRSQGCNSLIRDGASLVQSSDDVLSLIRSPELSAPPLLSPSLSSASSDDTDMADIAAARAFLQVHLGFDPSEVDELIRQCGLPASAVQIALLELELTGEIERLFGNRVVKIYRPHDG